MKVKALTNLGGVVCAHAGQEIDITNEAVLQDLLHQGVIQPVNANAEEVQRIMEMNGEQLAKAREQAIQERTMQENAYTEAFQKEMNQLQTQAEQQQVQMQQQMQQQAQSKAKADVQKMQQQAQQYTQTSMVQNAQNTQAANFTQQDQQRNQ